MAITPMWVWDGSAKVKPGIGKLAFWDGSARVSAKPAFVWDGTQKLLVWPQSITAPQNFAAVQGSGDPTDEVDVSWDAPGASEIFDNILVERAPDAAGSPGTWAQVRSQAKGVNDWTDSGLNPETTYWYRARLQLDTTPGAYSNYSAAVSVTTARASVTFGENTASGFEDDYTGVWEDAVIRAGAYDDTNYGSDSTLLTKYNGLDDDFTRQILIRIDVSAEAGETITGAVLCLYVDDDPGGVPANKLHIWQMVAGWTENGVTWNTLDGSTVWDGYPDSGLLWRHERVGYPDNILYQSPGWTEMTGAYRELTSAAFTAYVQNVLDGDEASPPAGRVNILVEHRESDNFRVFSSEGDDAKRPYLRLEFA